MLLVAALVAVVGVGAWVANRAPVKPEPQRPAVMDATMMNTEVVKAVAAAMQQQQAVVKAGIPVVHQQMPALQQQFPILGQVVHTVQQPLVAGQQPVVPLQQQLLRMQNPQQLQYQQYQIKQLQQQTPEPSKSWFRPGVVVPVLLVVAAAALFLTRSRDDGERGEPVTGGLSRFTSSYTSV